MTRCNHDGIFYRVFCVTLLIIAFTFTVILTNVFIDIDGLLSDKEKEKPVAPIVTTTPARDQETENNELFHQPEDKADLKAITEDVYIANIKEETEENNEVYEPYDNQDQESNDLKPEREYDYRTKRAIDTPNNKFHLANPKMKEILNNRLSTLLEELDAEESQSRGKVEKEKEDPVKPTDTSEPPDTTMKNDSEERDKSGKEENDVLHKAMHNILLQGIVGHMDLNDVYNKVHSLVRSFDQENDENPNRRSMHFDSEVKGMTNLHIHSYPELEKPRTILEGSAEILEAPQNLLSVESKFFDEMVKCEELQKQVNDVPHNAALAGSGIKKNDVKAPRMVIKTIIDIKTLNKNDKQNDSNVHINTNNIKGLIKLIYNGKPIQFSRLEDEEVKNTEVKQNKPEIKTDAVQSDNENVVDNFLDHALAQYLKKYPKLESKFKEHRRKRSVKVRKHSNSHANKSKQKEKPEEEELYVEIETHFDSKGINGEKKNKLVKSIVAKIQKALRMKDTSRTSGKTKKADMFQIKKRLQNPLKIKDAAILSNKIIPIENIVLRQIDPISKSVKVSDPSPKVYDQTGEEWKKTFTGSSFLSNLKAINSGEMGQVDLDYNQVAKQNGIPQRLQQPLNSDNVGQVTSNDGEYYNIGDLKFYVKEIDGTGFSIGFNQYVGDAPDPDSIKVFTGLQQLINVYNQKNETKTYPENGYIPDGEHEISKRDVSTFNGFGSIFNAKQVADSHSNEYKVTFDEHYLPYDSYSEIFEDGHKKVSLSIEKEKKSNQNTKNALAKSETQEIQFHTGSMPFLIDEDLFKKQLKPSEIFGLADLLNRKKRSPIVKIKKYSNLKTRIKSHINRYLNTNRRAKRVVKNKNKRNKRQIDKIRIIATDGVPHLARHSDENLFLVSDEHMFADRAVVRDMDAPEQEQSDNEENNDFVLPHHNQLSPYNIFSARSRHNSLMSKYPHLFLEEITRSKEEQDNPMFYSKLMDNYADIQKNIEPTPLPYTVVTPFDNNRPELRYPSANYYDNSDHRPNYKLTVKIIPKNLTDSPTGFKSVHTSINKTINRNGLRYLSQVNVSELSKIEHILNEDNNSNIHSYGRINTPEENRTNITEQITKQNPSDITRSLDQTTPKPTQINIDSGTFPLVKSIKDQQEKMKMLLKQHKQRIDEQLDNLKQEKQNLDSMIVRSNTAETTTTDVKRSDTIDVLLPLNPPQMLHLNKLEAGQLISNALMKLHDAPNLNDISDRNQLNYNQQVAPTTTSTTTQVTTTTTKATNTKQTTTTTEATTTTTNTPTPRKPDPERIKLLRTIQRNENLTNVILYKIDRNTNLLQHFLQKLTDRLEPVTRRPDLLIPERIKLPVPPKEWRGTEPFFSQPLPNLEVNKNATHVSIPFVYAYQQPYPLPAANNPVASVVYQGHIHTNAFNNAFGKNNEKARESKLPDKREANNTKFFLDDLEPGFKVVPVPMRKEPYDIPRVKNNITSEYRN